jgi:23S rRNA pseudouridine2605 synthase
MMSKNNFDRFIKKGEKGAKLKESIRQEKKKVRQETKAYFDKKKSEFKGKPGDVFSAENKPAGKEMSEPFKKPVKNYSSKKTSEPFSKPVTPSTKKEAAEPFASKKNVPAEAPMPLNKYVAHAGICSRRDAAELV